MNDIISPPSKWVSEMIARIEPGGTLIDIACGRGRPVSYTHLTLPTIYSV